MNAPVSDLHFHSFILHLHDNPFDKNSYAVLLFLTELHSFMDDVKTYIVLPYLNLVLKMSHNAA